MSRFSSVRKVRLERGNHLFHPRFDLINGVIRQIETLFDLFKRHLVDHIGTIDILGLLGKRGRRERMFDRRLMSSKLPLKLKFVSRIKVTGDIQPRVWIIKGDMLVCCAGLSLTPMAIPPSPRGRMIR